MNFLRIFQNHSKSGLVLPSDDAEESALPLLLTYADQSSTLDEASGRYTLHTGRPPPPYYADWYRFARDKRCMIDEYDRVHRDFKQFYQLAADNPTFFQDMVDRADEALEKNGAEIATMVIQDGQVTMTGWTAYGGYLSDLVGKFSRWLPNMTFFINGKDEPCVAFNFRAPGARENALLINDSTPFQLSHRPTSEFFAHQSGCDVPLEATGLQTSARNFSDFLIESAKPGYTTDLYPMFSMSKVSPCFSDILYPTQLVVGEILFSVQRSMAREEVTNLQVPSLSSQLFILLTLRNLFSTDWRGTASGGLIVGDNYHRFPRFRLMHIVRKHPDLMDVRITTFTESYCQEGCDRAAVLAAYNITGVGEPREDVHGFKYALDIDGATFSRPHAVRPRYSKSTSMTGCGYSSIMRRIARTGLSHPQQPIL
ncbi:hypothetical protein B0H14DRAFT_2575973 [Mycena olivaceomarginata]|nr:hypothetical protein B0H14DRAFT_2575973 [Mycena olivaceomarginata]